MKKTNSVYKICLIALAVVINIIGGNIALWLRLPIYLDVYKRQQENNKVMEEMKLSEE